MQAKPFQGRAQAVRCTISGTAAATPAIPDMHEAFEERARRQNQRTRVEVLTAATERLPAALNSGSPILLDSVARGVLPTILWHVPGSTPVYAATQDDLLRSFFG